MEMGYCKGIQSKLLRSRTDIFGHIYLTQISIACQFIQIRIPVSEGTFSRGLRFFNFQMAKQSLSVFVVKDRTFQWLSVAFYFIKNNVPILRQNNLEITIIKLQQYITCIKLTHDFPMHNKCYPQETGETNGDTKTEVKSFTEQPQYFQTS